MHWYVINAYRVVRLQEMDVYKSIDRQVSPLVSYIASLSMNNHSRQEMVRQLLYNIIDSFTVSAPFSL